MEEIEKKACDKKIKLSIIFLIINFIAFVLHASIKNKIISYIYYATLLILFAGFSLLIIVKLKEYKKETTYKITILYLGEFFIELVSVLTKLESCQDGF